MPIRLHPRGRKWPPFGRIIDAPWRGVNSQSDSEVAKGRGARIVSGIRATLPPMAAARPSASVILVRDGPSGLETFMVRRTPRSPVLPSAYVFPGGTIRADDLHLELDPHVPERLAEALSARSDSLVDAPQAVAYYVSALRELFEEAGVLLVDRKS